MRLLFLLLFFVTPFLVVAQPLTQGQIDDLVKKSMETFNVPGMAVAVIKDGEIYHINGYGVQSIWTKKAVNKNTLFGVASNTKAFTSAAIAQLVDQGKIKWNTKVSDIIPEFQLHENYATREFTIEDLLAHRSGLGLGAGDLMVFPASNTTTIDEMIHNLRYLKPVSSFRSKFDYNNLLYIVAGEVVTRVSGMPYNEYLKKNFFEPLGMNRAFLERAEIEADKNKIDGHSPVDGELQLAKFTFTEIGSPAAGIYTSIEDMTKWVQTLLNHGKYGNNLEKELISKQQLKKVWTPHTVIPAGKGPYNTDFMACGLGWFLKDINGYKEVSHTGGLLGIVSQVTMIPELDLGIIVLTNQESGAAFRSVTNSILDAYFGIEGEDRIKEYNERRLEAEEKAKEVVDEVERKLKETGKKVKIDTEDYVGTFQDDWFGKVSISMKGKEMYFTAEKNSDLTGKMVYYKGTSFVVYWDDASLNADAFVNFDLDTEGKAQGFTMSPVSPLTDFSYNYQDLKFKINK